MKLTFFLFLLGMCLLHQLTEARGSSLFGERYLFRNPGARPKRPFFRGMDRIEGVDWSSLCQKEYLKNLYPDMCPDE